MSHYFDSADKSQVTEEVMCQLASTKPCKICRRDRQIDDRITAGMDFLKSLVDNKLAEKAIPVLELARSELDRRSS
jgi:hypothetical protein